MDFIIDEAEDDSQTLQFSDEEEIEVDIGEFINDQETSEEGVSFYREKDTLNLNNYPKFSGQTRDPREAIFEDNESFLGKILNQTFLLLKIEKMFILITSKGLKKMQRISRYFTEI